MMKTLDATRHKTNLINILLDIYKNEALSSVLGFKGGTAALLFYGLPRLSVDLDFDLIKPKTVSPEKLNKIIGEVTKILAAKYQIKDRSTKYYTLFWQVSYGAGLTRIKVEVSTRPAPFNRYDLIPFYGVAVKVLDIRDMIAHKMIAVMDRKTLANRDLFDVHYFLGLPAAGEINYDIIKDKTGKSPREFYRSLLKFVDKIDPKSVLSGLGEILSNSQKNWAKAKLIAELKGLIQRQIDIMA